MGLAAKAKSAFTFGADNEDALSIFEVSGWPTIVH
jgi:hypothetical protein